MRVRHTSYNRRFSWDLGRKRWEDTVRVVLLNDGAVEPCPNGRKEDGEYKWKIVGKEVHAINKDGEGVIFRINPDGS